MSHEMYENDRAIYFEKTAWHGLGTVVTERYEPREALRMAGLDYQIIPSTSIDFNYTDSSGYGQQGRTTAKVANVREDTGDVVGWVSPNYQILQNSELAEVAYSIAGDDTKVETFGSLRNGSRIYCLINMSEFDTGVNGKDTIQQYMLLCNGHDGTLAFSGLPTSIRVVCSNTLNMALSTGNKNMIRITHSGDMAEKIMSAKDAMLTYREIGRFFEDTVQDLASKHWDTKTIQKFWLDMYGMIEEPFTTSPKTDEEQAEYTKALTTVNIWAETFDKEVDIAGATAWNAANAVTNWVQHKTATRGRKTSLESRIDQNLFGKNADMTVKVMKSAMCFDRV
jgi:phage/plasmid-like protein (TIGR03299 family)